MWRKKEKSGVGKDCQKRLEGYIQVVFIHVYSTCKFLELLFHNADNLGLASCITIIFTLCSPAQQLWFFFKNKIHCYNCNGAHTLKNINLVGNKYIPCRRHTCYQSRNGREKTITLNFWRKIEKFRVCFQRPYGQISRIPFEEDLWSIYQCPTGISIQSYQLLPCCGLK